VFPGVYWHPGPQQKRNIVIQLSPFFFEEETVLENVAFLLTLGKVLSILASLFVAGTLISIWRRESFPPVAYGGVSLSNRRIRWVWFLVLSGGFILGVNEDPILTTTDSSGSSESSEGDPLIRGVSVTVPLPFYRFERERSYRDGVLLEESELEGFLIPWQLLSALFAYFVLVLRWNPENRWALRILQGRRWKRPDPAV
jgi:hypothetical protein